MEVNSNAMSNSSRKELIAVGAGYALTVALIVAGSLVRPRGLWGFSAYSFFGSPWVWVPAVLAIIWAAVTVWLSRRAGVGAEIAGETGIRQSGMWAVGHVAAMGLLFVLLRTQAHFLGDGYTLLASYASANPIIKARAMGEAVLHLWVRDVIGGADKQAALLSFRVISIGAGLAYLAMLWWAAVRLLGRSRKAVLFAVGMGTPGYMLLFFGYVELYALFVTAVGAFGLVGLLAVEGRVNRWWVLLPLGMAVVLHVMGVVLIPAAVYVLLAKTRVGAWVERLSPTVRGAAALVVIAGAVAAFLYLSQESMYFKLAFLPLLENRFTADGYTLFSGRHLLDVANQALMLFPGLLVLLPVLVMLFRLERLKGRAVWFLALLALSTWGAVFLFDPKIGMPRDWDLFAFAGVPLALVCLYLPVREMRAVRAAMPAVLLAIGLNGIVLGGRVVLQTDGSQAAEQFRRHMLWDIPKHQTGWSILVNYHSTAGDSVRAQEEYRFWLEQYPGYELNRLGLEQLRTGRSEAAATLFRQVIEMNPTFGPAYGNLGSAYLNMRLLDSAETYLGIALGINPYSPATLVNHGRLLWAQGDREHAVEEWRRALTLDSTEYRAAMGLAEYYRDQRDREQYFHYLARAVAHSEAPPARLAELGVYYLSTGRAVEGREYLREAVARGLDSTTVDRLRQRYPELEL